MILDIALILSVPALYWLLRLLFRPGRQHWRANSHTTGTRNGRPWWKDKEPY